MDMDMDMDMDVDMDMDMDMDTDMDMDMHMHASIDARRTSRAAGEDMVADPLGGFVPVSGLATPPAALVGLPRTDTRAT